MELEKIKQKDIKEYLSSLGIQPCRESGQCHIYYSPFREEVEPSFYLWKNDNRWRDFGNGEHGDIINLVKELRGVNFKEALRILTEGENIVIPKFKKPTRPPKQGIEILSVNPISNNNLIGYLSSREIPVDLARIYCSQIEWRFPSGKRPGMIYTGVGFGNDSGGWELRNSFFKVSNSPKNVTTIPGEKNKNMIFEGFIDFLSALVWFKKEKFTPSVIVLNSLGYITTLIPFLKEVETNYLFIDNGKAANEKIVALREAEVPMEDCRYFLDGYEDFNDMLVASKK